MIKERQREATSKQIQDARKRKEAILQVALLNDPDIDITLVKIQNEMEEELSTYEEPLEIVLFGDNKSKQEGKLKTYREKQSRLEKHRGQTFLMILGKCSQELMDRMKQDVIWTTVVTSYIRYN